MSRIGKLPVAVPAGVNVTIKDSLITVKGPKGELKRKIPVGVAAKPVSYWFLVLAMGVTSGHVMAYFERWWPTWSKVFRKDMFGSSR